MLTVTAALTILDELFVESWGSHSLLSPSSRLQGHELLLLRVNINPDMTDPLSAVLLLHCHLLCSLLSSHTLAVLLAAWLKSLIFKWKSCYAESERSVQLYKGLWQNGCKIIIIIQVAYYWVYSYPSQILKAHYVVLEKKFKLRILIFTMLKVIIETQMSITE